MERRMTRKNDCMVITLRTFCLEEMLKTIHTSTVTIKKLDSLAQSQPTCSEKSTPLSKCILHSSE